MTSSSRPPTVAVDVNPATRPQATGTENFARAIARRLPKVAPDLRWRFYASRPRAGLGIDVLVLPFPRMWTQLRLPAALAGARPDLLFVPAHAIPFAWPGKVLTVVHDLAFERYPDAYPAAERAYLKLTTRWAAMRCRLLIAVSESTRADLVELYGVPADRIRVIPLGVDAAAVPPAPSSKLAELGIKGEFVLQVGRIEARKNQTAALAAIEKLADVALVVAGPERDPAIAAELRRSSRCHVLGVVDQPVLELLYRRAGAVIVPSLYEGFGLPVLEAMARGKVVVASKSSSLPEVGADAALYFHPGLDAAALAEVIEVALKDRELRTKLARAARARAAKFSWDRTAKGIVEVIRELV